MFFSVEGRDMVFQNAKNVVLLVDNKKRDLFNSALIAHQLEKQGVTCFLEPLGAYKAALSAYDPDMIVFNHLTAGHLVEYSKRLARLGVLTAVLPNEGISYDREDLLYNAGRHHTGAHIDYFFCWNEAHKEALRECGFDESVHIEVVGVPRFDFYFDPWARLFRESRSDGVDRPSVLLCTNFVFSKYQELPASVGDKFFSKWKDLLPSHKNYQEVIAVNHRSRTRFFDFAEALVKEGRYMITLRPHPSEDISVYERWFAGLSPDQKRYCRLDPDSNITSLILGCDIEISCETCTTALESWVAGKPTIELVFERHPMYFHDDIASLNVLCDTPEDLPDLVEQQLNMPEQKSFMEGRVRHLAQWCNAPNGTSALQMGNVIASAVFSGERGGKRSYGMNDKRRGLRLMALKRLGLPYNYDPFLPGKERIFGGRYRIKRFGYEKAIRPSDVAAARSLLRSVDTP